MDDAVARDLNQLALSRCLDAVVFIDDKNDVIFFNDAAERLWGLPRGEVMGRNVSHLVPLQWRGRHDDFVDTQRRTGVARILGTTREVPVDRADGTRAWGQLALSRAEMGDSIFYAAFVREITDDVRRREQMRILSLVAETTGRIVMVMNNRLEAVYINHAFFEIFGYDPAEMIGKSPFRLILGDAIAGELMDRVADRLKQLPGCTEEVLLSDSSGKGVWVSATYNRVIDSATGEITNIVAVLADITQIKQIEELQRDVLAAVVSDQPLGDVADLICRKVEAIAPGVLTSIITVTEDGLLQPIAGPSLPQNFNAAVEGMAVGPKAGSCGTAAFLGAPVLVSDIATDPLWDDFRWLPLPQNLLACWSVPIKLRSGKVAGTFAFYFTECRSPSPWHEQIVNACIHLCALALERQESQRHIARLASMDSLTGLPNRSEIINLMSDELLRAEALKLPLALLFLDLDHFKDVNDTLGHTTGDRLLVEMSRRLKAQLRTGDVVGRIGGDEFVILIHNCRGDEAARISARLLEYLATPVNVEGLNLSMSVSIGITLFPEHGADAETLLKHADAAMYEAKREGRGKFRFFTEDLNQRVQNRLVLSVALRKAIRNKALKQYYQPQVCIADGSLHGVEALSRWHDPVHGDVPAPRFIALAEEYGLVDGIDEWGVETACAQIAKWRAEGLPVPHISVNLSPLSFRSGTIVDVIAGCMRQHNIQPSDLRVEITERVMMDQHPNSLATARAIETLGVHIAMDDFGTGYSSLSSLARLPIAELKIDRSFMMSLEQDQNSQALATAVVRIGQSLGMSVVAEGVETEAQMALLRELKCHAAQGYLFARPLSIEDFEAWFIARLQQNTRPTASRA
ncbi:EAL domain-containing protein [Xanthobacter agilis]|jgi:diguanylate cyclase (GGDEF)-like protein/PAS domain S-box-containing protein|uniref:Diguanylate cyclase (GGDEF)-like protein/PAS domain S-box-containing protein n=1 Tax=Xanthobacter agilis TaxID=47492 RepID=A0ABU0LHI0_XANAG|nr:EAL domain-containing protein [Xanthobacter agilis]MDQ0506596.1 diguanylate cyclase (GGDEF)-like protein/PAS domain S-box-containing protein [Xanthobacter agilis]